MSKPLRGVYALYFIHVLLLLIVNYVLGHVELPIPAEASYTIKIFLDWYMIVNGAICAIIVLLAIFDKIIGEASEQQQRDEDI